MSDVTMQNIVYIAYLIFCAIVGGLLGMMFGYWGIILLIPLIIGNYYAIEFLRSKGWIKNYEIN